MGSLYPLHPLTLYQDNSMFYYDEKTFERHAERPNAIDAEISERARRNQQMTALRSAQEAHDAQQRLAAQRRYQEQVEQAARYQQFERLQERQRQSQQRQGTDGLRVHPDFQQIVVDAYPVAEPLADGTLLLEFEVPKGCPRGPPSASTATSVYGVTFHRR